MWVRIPLLSLRSSCAHCVTSNERLITIFVFCYSYVWIFGICRSWSILSCISQRFVKCFHWHWYVYHLIVSQPTFYGKTSRDTKICHKHLIVFSRDARCFWTWIKILPGKKNQHVLVVQRRLNIKMERKVSELDKFLICTRYHNSNLGTHNSTPQQI